MSWKSKFKMIGTADADWLAVIIGFVNILMGITLIPSIQTLQELDLFTQLYNTNSSGVVWVVIFISMGFLGLWATFERSKRAQIAVYIFIMLFWFWMASGWASLKQVPPHGTTNLALNTIGSIIVVLRQWGDLK